MLVGVEKRRAGANAGHGDQAVEHLPNSDTGSTRRSIALGREREVLQPFEPKNGERAKVSLDDSRLPLKADSLQDLGQYDVGEGDRLAALDQVDALARLWVSVRHSARRPRRWCRRRSL